MLSDAIASLGIMTYAVTHRGNNGFDAHGRAIAPTASAVPIVGMMQPLTGREISRLPEGLHQKELRGFWTTGSLTVTDSDAGIMGDYVTADAITWEVIKSDDWASMTFGKYKHYVLSRVDP